MAVGAPVVVQGQCSAVHLTFRDNAVQCSAVQCSAVQCSAVQGSAVQCSAVQCGPGAVGGRSSTGRSRDLARCPIYIANILFSQDIGLFEPNSCVVVDGQTDR
jgi:hypothetical protein